MTIKASELRIGNLYLQFGNIVDVSYITIRDLIDSSPQQLWCKPIPITEEWLIKFGWKYYNGKNDGTLTMDFGCKIDVDFIKGKLNIKSHYEGDNLYRETRIYYVHSLQNLYFALTGEELTISSN
jgi:hypothetical protein